MLNAKATFLSNLALAREQTALFDFLNATIQSPANFDDILRWQWAYSVSAFDKLLHDLIRIGMVASYAGTRLPTAKFLSEGISITVHQALTSATIPPAETIFEQLVVNKLKTLSFQDPDKVADGLSLIWAKTAKWAEIAGAMGSDDHNVRTTLRLITNRRNAIVHEADMDPLTNGRTPISRVEANTVTDFLEACGNAIVQLVL